MLSAKLDLPQSMPAHTFAIFAHCFTCNKNFVAVRNISRALTLQGIAVLRFDFTGLGDSEGEFADSNLSTNVTDLLAAAAYLEKEWEAPTFMIGHSLGGAAAILAATSIPSIKAISTIGSPSDPAHVQHLFVSELAEIEEKGEAEVKIGMRPVKVKKQFVDDLQNKDLLAIVSDLRLPLAIFHSPQDMVVEISNAGKLYDAAFHPKSFISLDGADHMLMDPKDAEYVGSMLASWADRYLDTPDPIPLETNHQVAVRIGDEGYTSEVMAGNHLLTADEPLKVGGNDYGPSPYEFVSSGLAACTAMTLRMYADRKGWDLQEVTVHVDYGKEHCEDCDDLDNASKKIDVFNRKVEIVGDLDEKQRERLMQIADKCPVHKTLHSASTIRTQMA